MKRDWLTLAFGIVLVGAVVGLSLRQNLTEDAPTPPPEAVAAAVPDGPEAPAATALEPAPAPPGSAARSSAPAPSTGRVATRTAPPTPAVSAVPVAAGTDVALNVQSDVPGASVFLDREFVGTTPLALRGLSAGAKQLNVTATGHEGYADTIELKEGANRVIVEFLKVRLNQSLPVLHRHAMGFCQGTLAANVKGVTYETTNADDAFAIAMSEIDQFDVDYIKKNLRVRRRGGRTWNFTNDSADALFVFHRDVSKARQRLATSR